MSIGTENLKMLSFINTSHDMSENAPQHGFPNDMTSQH